MQQNMAASINHAELNQEENSRILDKDTIEKFLAGFRMDKRRRDKIIELSTEKEGPNLRSRADSRKRNYSTREDSSGPEISSNLSKSNAPTKANSTAKIIPVSIRPELESAILDDPAELAKFVIAAAPGCDIDHIKRGRGKTVLVYGKTEEEFNKLLKKENWTSGNITPWLPESHFINQAVVVRGVETSISEIAIENALTNEGLKPVIVKRMNWGPESKPSKSVKVIFRDKADKDALISRGLRLFMQKYKVDNFKTSPAITQCFRCQGFNHLASTCVNEEACLRCGKDGHNHRSCTVSREDTENMRCKNCGDPHAANFPFCPKRKEAAKSRPSSGSAPSHTLSGTNSYAQVAAKCQSPPPHAEQELLGILATMAEALLHLMNRVVAKEPVDSSITNEIVALSANKHLGTNICGESISLSIATQSADTSINQSVTNSSAHESSSLLSVPPSMDLDTSGFIAQHLVKASNVTKPTNPLLKGSNNKIASILEPVSHG
jgi:hypothetical protein